MDWDFESKYTIDAMREIRIKKLGWSGSGYKILPSWKRPSGKLKTAMDAWIPGLAPSYILRRRRSMGLLTPKEFAQSYIKELHSDAANALMKPLALLSLRRHLVLLCDCQNLKPNGSCFTKTLLQAFRSLRSKGDFSLDFLSSAKGEWKAEAAAR